MKLWIAAALLLAGCGAASDVTPPQLDAGELGADAGTLTAPPPPPGGAPFAPGVHNYPDGGTFFVDGGR